MCLSHDYDYLIMLFTLLIILTFRSIYAYHILILSCYHLGSPLLLSYASIFHLTITASHLFDYLCTTYIPSHCSTFHSLLVMPRFLADFF